MSLEQKNNRYSDTILAEFKEILENKLEKTLSEIGKLIEQKDDLASSLKDNGFDTDDNFAYKDVEFLQSQIYRQKKHLRDLENALIRVRNKAYGICVVSGQLIDKRRLMAVPTTTKAMAAKLAPQKAENYSRDDDVGPRPVPVKKESKIITKILRKPAQNTGKVIEGVDDLFLENTSDDLHEENKINIDFDSLPDESYDEI